MGTETAELVRALSGSISPFKQRRLPLEVLHIVFEFCDKDDLTRCSRTCTFARNVCADLLYYAVRLEAAKQVVLWCRTITQCPNLAKRVRSLTIASSAMVDCKPLGALPRLVNSSLKKMGNLKTLALKIVHIGAVSRIYLSDILGYFKLEYFSTTLPLDDDLFEWMKKQETVESISIGSMDDRSITLSPTPNGDLRNLKRVSGTPEIALKLLRLGPNIELVDLKVWDAAFLNVETTSQFIVNLREVQSIPLVHLSVHIVAYSDGWAENEISIASLAEWTPHLPDLKSFRLHFAGMPAPTEALDVVGEFVRAIPSLSAIFASTTKLDSIFNDVFDDVDFVYRTTAQWGNINPSLRLVNISGGNFFLPSINGDWVHLNCRTISKGSKRKDFAISNDTIALWMQSLVPWD